MKKLFSISIVLLMLFSFAACGSSGAKIDLADGVYAAEIDPEYGAYGWTDRLTITVKGGKMTEVEFDSYNEAGERKSKAVDYGMTPEPAEWMPKVAENVKKAKTPDDIAAVAGASLATENAKLLYAAILEDGQDGAIIYVVPK